MAELDVVTFDIVKNSMVAAVHEASTMLERIAYHPVVSLGRDRTSGLLTPDGRLVCHGHTDCSPHYGTIEVGVQELLKDIPSSQMRPGEAYIFNDAIRTGTHVNEMRLHKPIFYKGELFAIALVILHWPDVGGPMPGTFNPRATEAYAEGIRIPPTKILENDEIVETIYRIIALNIRGAEERRCDFTAQIQAVKTIEKRIIELCDKYGPDTLRAAMEDLFEYSERMLRHEVEQLPEGEYEFEDWGDADVMSPGEPPIYVHCKLTVKDGTLTFDYSNSGPAPRSSWGAPRATCIAGTMTGLMCSFPHLFPINHGILRSVNIITKPGTSVHVLEPAGTTGYCSGSFDKCEAVSMACLGQPLAKVKPHRVCGGWVSLTNLCIGGVRPKSKRSFVDYTWAMGGGGARTFKDGPSYAAMRFLAAGNTIPMELEERWFPLLFTKFEATPDSGGHGKFRGGCGLERRLKVRSDAVVTIHGDREKFPPHGVGGGTNGGPGALKLNVGTAEERQLDMYATDVRVTDRDEIYFCSAGGGGYGDPLQRDPHRVLEDVMDGYVTLPVARDIYGVSINVIDEEALAFEIDAQETSRLRMELAQKPRAEGIGPFEVNPLLKNLIVAREMGEEEALEDCALVRPPGW